MRRRRSSPRPEPLPVDQPDTIRLWQWEYTDELGKRRVTRWRMSENTVKQFAHAYKNAVKVEGTLEVRRVMGSTSDWQRSPPRMEPGTD